MLHTYYFAYLTDLVRTIQSSPCVSYFACYRPTSSVWRQEVGTAPPGTWTSPCRAGSVGPAELMFCSGQSLDHSGTSVSIWHKYLQKQKINWGLLSTLNDIDKSADTISAAIIYIREDLIFWTQPRLLFCLSSKHIEWWMERNPYI